VSVNDYQPDNALGLVRNGHVDAVQVIYNAFLRPCPRPVMAEGSLVATPFGGK
jgi:hypothetical protein